MLCASLSDPQKKAESNGQSLSVDWLDPSHLVFDVGTNCYVIASLPDLGAVNIHDTFPADLWLPRRSISFRDRNGADLDT